MAQDMELRGSKIALPEGNVIGAAFYDEREMLFLQQEVYSSGEGGRGIISRRHVSSWSLKSHSMLTRRLFDPKPPDAKTYPCGRVEVSVKTNKIFLCRLGTSLEVLNPDTLNTIGRVAYKADQCIYDFAVDDQRGRVFVLGLIGSNRSPYLASYSLSDGTQQQEVLLPSTDGTVMKLAIVPKTGKVAVAVDRYIHGPQKSDIYVCESKLTLSCVSVALVTRVLQIDVLGERLLAATDATADRKKECLIGIDLNTHLVFAHEYCSPATGVHYAVGVADDNYIVGFTGTAKRVWWREENLSEESSFSVWTIDNPKVAALAKEPGNFGSKQFGASIFTSRTEPMFIAHVGDSNLLYVYSIVDSK